MNQYLEDGGPVEFGGKRTRLASDSVGGFRELQEVHTSLRADCNQILKCQRQKKNGTVWPHTWWHLCDKFHLCGPKTNQPDFSIWLLLLLPDKDRIYGSGGGIGRNERGSEVGRVSAFAVASPRFASSQYCLSPMLEASLVLSALSTLSSPAKFNRRNRKFKKNYNVISAVITAK